VHYPSCLVDTRKLPVPDPRQCWKPQLGADQGRDRLPQQRACRAADVRRRSGRLCARVERLCTGGETVRRWGPPRVTWSRGRGPASVVPMAFLRVVGDVALDVASPRRQHRPSL